MNKGEDRLRKPPQGNEGSQAARPVADGKP